jgi:hypothetical protein
LILWLADVGIPVGGLIEWIPAVGVGVFICIILFTSIIQIMTFSLKGRKALLWMIFKLLGWTLAIATVIIIPDSYSASDQLKATAFFIILGSVSGLGIVRMFMPSSTAASQSRPPNLYESAAVVKVK